MEQEYFKTYRLGVSHGTFYYLSHFDIFIADIPYIISNHEVDKNAQINEKGG